MTSTERSWRVQRVDDPSLAPDRLYRFAEGPAPVAYCLPEAERFDAWCGQLVAQLEEAGIGQEEVRVAKLLLQDKWWDVRCSVEASHRVHLEGEDGGRCVMAVYVDRYEEIMAIAARLAPPSLRRETRAPRVQRQRLPGVFIGTKHGDRADD